MSAYDTTRQEGTDTELTAFDGRPTDCTCWNSDGELSCWACYRDGFDTPNPTAGDD